MPATLNARSCMRHAENQTQNLLVNRKSTKYSILQYLIYQNLLSCCELPNSTKRVIQKLHTGCVGSGVPSSLSLPCQPLPCGPETSLGWKYMFVIHLSKAIHQFSRGLSNKLSVLPWCFFCISTFTCSNKAMNVLINEYMYKYI